MLENQSTQPVDFIRAAVCEDLKMGRYSRVHTRFPPEPNGYLHIGHAKAICIDFGIAAEFGGKCNLRFDDTNPVKEEVEYVESIMQDIRWLGFDWEDRLFYASDYFGRLFEYAVQLIKKGKAYVCDLSAEEVRTTRGTLTVPGSYPTIQDAVNAAREGDTVIVDPADYEGVLGRAKGRKGKSRWRPTSAWRRRSFSIRHVTMEPFRTTSAGSKEGRRSMNLRKQRKSTTPSRPAIRRGFLRQHTSGRIRKIQDFEVLAPTRIRKKLKRKFSMRSRRR
jgi:hypothetical protein